MKYFFLIVTIAVFILGLYFLGRGLQFYFYGQSHIATLDEVFEGGGDYSIGANFFYTYKFFLKDSAEHTGRSFIGSELPEYNTNDGVAVLYLPSSPDISIVDTWKELFLIPLLLFVGATGLGILSILLFLRKKNDFMKSKS